MGVHKAVSLSIKNSNIRWTILSQVTCFKVVKFGWVVGHFFKQFHQAQFACINQISQTERQRGFQTSHTRWRFGDILDIFFIRMVRRVVCRDDCNDT